MLKTSITLSFSWLDNLGRLTRFYLVAKLIFAFIRIVTQLLDQPSLAAFPKGNIYLKLRDELGALYQDETFSHLFPSAGCPAESPGRLAMITVFQFAEGLSDRAAASFSSPSKRSFTASSAPTTRIVGKTRT